MQMLTKKEKRKKKRTLRPKAIKISSTSSKLLLKGRTVVGSSGPSGGSDVHVIKIYIRYFIFKRQTVAALKPVHAPGGSWWWRCCSLLMEKGLFHSTELGLVNDEPSTGGEVMTLAKRSFSKKSGYLLPSMKTPPSPPGTGFYRPPLPSPQPERQRWPRGSSAGMAVGQFRMHLSVDS